MEPLAMELERIVRDSSLATMPDRVVAFVERNAARAGDLPQLAFQNPDGTPILCDGAPLYLDLAHLARLFEEARHAPAPAITRAVSVNVLDLYSRKYEIHTTEDKQQKLVFPQQSGWVVVPCLSSDALHSILQRGVKGLSSKTGIDTLEWQVEEAHRQHTEGKHDFRNIRIEGGWSELAHGRLGLKDKEAPARVREIVHAQAHLQFQVMGRIQGNLLTYTEPTVEAPGRRSLVTLTLGDMLLSGFVFALREELGEKSLSAREAQQLVPILGKAALIGRPKDHGAQRRMVWRLAILLRDHADELAERGHVHLPLETWAAMAAEAGAPRSGDFLPRVRRAWEEGDSRTPPLIARVKGPADRFTLDPSRRSALEFLVQGGQRTLSRRAEGKRSAAAKRAALARVAEPPPPPPEPEPSPSHPSDPPWIHDPPHEEP
jgi:hypothetical protein